MFKEYDKAYKLLGSFEKNPEIVTIKINKITMEENLYSMSIIN